MSSYDNVKYEAPCKSCGAILTDWQSKDGPRLMRTLDPNQVRSFYTVCGDCNEWNTHVHPVDDPKDRKKIYEDLVSPLMAQVIDICQQYNMPVFTEIQFAPDGFFKTVVPGQDSHPLMRHLAALSECTTRGGVNIDKHLSWIVTEAQEKGHNSLYLTQMGIPTLPARNIDIEADR